MLAPVTVGAMLGLSVALPFGPVSLMCVQRTITDGLRHGLVAGAGAASAHGVFALSALYGGGLFAAELAHWGGPIRWVSAALLIGLGVRMLVRRRPAGMAAGLPRATAAYGSTFALALSNPMTLLPYLGVASGVASAEAAGGFSSWSVAGVIVGAAGWYAVLVGGASLLRLATIGGVTRHLGSVAGCMLIGLGAWVGLR